MTPGLWTPALELSADRAVTAGSPELLAAAVRRGADLRVYTEFRHGEHIDPGSADRQLVREVSDFPVTYLVDDRWTAGVMTLRQPVSLSHEGFGRPSMSFFLYNQDGSQGIARPFLDGGGPEPRPDHSAMPKYAEGERWDDDTTAPSSAFVYRFERYRFLVRDRWRQLLHTDGDGAVVSGSLGALTAATDTGATLKVGVRGLIDDHPEHELFVECGPLYHYTETPLLVAETRPLVRVRSSAPLAYRSGGWDFGWLIVRSDGRCHYLRYDPYTLAPEQQERRLAVRWFADEDVSPGETEDFPE
jgi:hypothetical protein